MANKAFSGNFLDRNEIVSPLQYNLIKTLKNNGPLTRRELVNQLNTPRTTIYDNLVKLQKENIVKKFSRNNGKRGRPKIFWEIKK
jgi:predicted ArsR family transcriptional regulator